MTEFEIMTLVTSILAIIIAGLSLVFSSKSNSKSAKVQELQSRPWLIATIHKNDETKRFYDIIEDNGNIYWQVDIDIENKGTTPANNISIPQNANLRDIKTTNVNLDLHLENIILGQGQKYRYNFKMGGQPKNPNDLQEMLKQYRDNDKGLIVKFIVNYSGLIESSKQYKTKYTFDIKAYIFTILNESEYK